MWLGREYINAVLLNPTKSYFASVATLCYTMSDISDRRGAHLRPSTPKDPELQHSLSSQETQQRMGNTTYTGPRRETLGLHASPREIASLKQRVQEGDQLRRYLRDHRSVDHAVRKHQFYQPPNPTHFQKFLGKIAYDRQHDGPIGVVRQGVGSWTQSHKRVNALRMSVGLPQDQQINPYSMSAMTSAVLQGADDPGSDYWHNPSLPVHPSLLMPPRPGSPTQDDPSLICIIAQHPAGQSSGPVESSSDLATAEEKTCSVSSGTDHCSEDVRAFRTESPAPVELARPSSNDPSTAEHLSPTEPPEQRNILDSDTGSPIFFGNSQTVLVASSSTVQTSRGVWREGAHDPLLSYDASGGNSN